MVRPSHGAARPGSVRLRSEIEAALPFEQVREALERVAGGYTRGKIVLQFER